MPGYITGRKDYTEAGLLSANREYLRVIKQRLAYDICAAPYGTGFFFSTWLTQKPPSLVFLNLVLIVGGFLFILFLISKVVPFWLAMFALFITVPVAFFLTLWLVAIIARAGITQPEDAIMTVPLLGAIYSRMFAPATYYKIDTTLMFHNSVHAVVMEAIESVTTQKGLRALSEEERKPINYELLRR